jgi:hypothetical protein
VETGDAISSLTDLVLGKKSLALLVTLKTNLTLVPWRKGISTQIELTNLMRRLDKVRSSCEINV